MPPRNRLDVYNIQSVNVAIFREAFDRVVELTGFQLQPVKDSTYIWDFQHPETLSRGRLLHVEGFLREGLISMSNRGTAYLVTRQEYSLALVFPTAPRGMRLNKTSFKVISKEDRKAYPSGWPERAVAQVIRSRFRKFVILDEAFLLEIIGLRTEAATT